MRHADPCFVMLLLTPAPVAAALAILVAVGVDRLWGEPPARLHPVVWMGHYLTWAGRRIAPLVPVQGTDARRFAGGALAWLLAAAATAAMALMVQQALQGLAAWVAGVLLGLLLKPLMAWRMLHDEVLAVETALDQSLQAGRQQLGRLVSRDTAPLDGTQVRSAAISTLAENLNDSVVAPLFWFVLAGLPGAAVYRLANTADAMWGYRGMRNGQDWTWAGKWAARADDVLSWVPARLCALLLLLVAAVHGRPVAPGETRRQAGRTPSPNSGWPMAAMALALGIRLEKTGVYVLHAQGQAPAAADTQRALTLAGHSVWLCSLLAALVAWSLA